ncbi:ATP-binding protein [Mucilaginibacter sp.]|uniref:nSTAND3 domain-containing NTPase n=1 Tax=Mucilaginibacter sp. TaxID=1882438 RepID=UPI0026251C16|nr:ATP-binding protein [Mucilaginibacter sp.]MDB4919369.1 hypothetical protein [Mucilaginibacter sp.]
MDRINWLNYTSTDFQYFCNALLSFEISKQFEPFAAPGRDGGIDGSYEGQYSQFIGKWRFQYKFHVTARKQAFSSIKAELRQELFKVVNEDIFVLLTNIELLPQEHNELKQIAQEAILDKQQLREVLIWDGAKIFTIYLKYPLLKIWLESGFNTAQLQPYALFYKSLIEASTKDPFTLSNHFVAREEQLQQLGDFLKNPALNAVMITGEAGMGKTRLVIEFFKKKIDHNEDWLALVLANYSIDFDKLVKSTSGDKNYIILVDDAHQYRPEQIADLKRFAALKRANQVKVIFTFRNIEFNQATQLVKEYEEVDTLSMPLGQLNETDTRLLFEEEVKNTYLEYYTAQLAQISRGRPILIVAILKAAELQIPVPQIKSAKFLYDYVNNYFRSFILRIKEKTNLSEVRATNFLRLICLLEPINILDNEWIDQLSQSENIETETIRYIFEQLSEQHFLSAKFQSEIKPDYYSDILLMGAEPSWLAQKIDLYYNSIDNIIKNLATVDEVNSNKDRSQTLLDQLLEKYIKNLSSTDSYEEFTRILKTIYSLNGYKSAKAIEAVNCYYHILTNPSHHFHERLIGITGAKHFGIFQEYVSVKNILQDLLHRTEHLDYVFEMVFKFFAIIPDKDIFKATFDFTYVEAVYRFALVKQLFYVQKSSLLLHGGNNAVTRLILDSYKELLKLNFTSHSMDAYGKAITIRRYYLPDQPSVHELRASIIKQLDELYFKTDDIEIKEIAIKQLLDIPREIASSKREKFAYNHPGDTIAVLNFLERAITDLPINFQGDVLDKLYWFKKWNIGDEYLEPIRAIESKLVPTTVVEELIFLFSKAENDIDSDANLVRENLREKSRELISGYLALEVAEGIAALFKTSKEIPFNFWDFTNVLYLEFPAQLRTIYDYLWDNERNILFQLGSGMLQALYFVHKDEDFYWKKIKQLLEEGSFQAFNIILHIYAFRKERSPINYKDADLILQVYNNRFPENSTWLSLSLLNIFYVDREKALTVIGDFLEECSQKDGSQLFMYLFDGFEDYYTEARALLLEHSLRFSLEYEIENALKAVIRKEGFTPVFNYLKNRIALKAQNISENNINSGYEAIPFGEGRLLTSFDSEAKANILMDAFDWYIHLDFKEGMEYYASVLLDYLNSSKLLIEPVYSAIIDKIEQNKSDKIRLNRLVQCLSIFEQKNEYLIESVEIIYDYVSKTYENDYDYFQNFKWNCSQAITSMGVKSGTSGEPFPADLALKKLLENSIEKYSYKTPFADFLTRLLTGVNDEINRTIDRYKNEW